MGFFSDDDDEDRGDKAKAKELAKIKAHKFKPGFWNEKKCSECGVRKANHHLVGGVNT